MAIFYSGIKGLNFNSNSEIYSYLLWTNVNKNSSDKNTSKSNPTIWLGDDECLNLDDVPSNGKNNGMLLTSKVENFLEGYKDNSNKISYLSFMNENQSLLAVYANTSANKFWFESMNNADINFKGKVYFDDIDVKSFTIGNSFGITGEQSLQFYCSIPATFSQQVTCQAQINAMSFNATSDKRAKTNIIKADFSALDIVKDLPIYTFMYKNTDINSIGIIAQEAQDIDINGFNIVNNKEASGENNDYMTINESKLIYILWKAVQEQQEEIQSLKKQLGGK